jgi:hypothetical protein
LIDIKAEGFEKDRTSLKTPRDFFYDHERGEYTAKSDGTLHGQCQAPSVSSRSSWRKLDAGPFSISAPPGWEFHQLAGVDSYVGLVEPRAQCRMIAVDGFGESGLRFNLVFFLNGVFRGLESNPS